MEEVSLQAFCTANKIGYTEVDGADPVNKEIRTSLFALAGWRLWP